jgi:hypothetical protein
MGHSGWVGLGRVVAEHMTGAVLLPVVPSVVGALLSMALPTTDRMAMRRVAMLATITTAIFTLHALQQRWHLWPAAMSLLAGFALAFRAGAPRVAASDSRLYGLCGNLWLALMASALLLPATTARLPLALATIPWLVLVLWLGKSLRGSASLRSFGLFWLADGLSWWSPAGLPMPVRAVLSWLPGLARCVVGPFGSWQQPVQDHGPMTAAAFGWLQAPVAFVCWLSWFDGVPFLHPILPPMLVLVAITSALLSVAERDLRRLIGHVVGAVMPWFILSIGYGNPTGRATALVGVSAVALLAVMALATVEAIERRTESRDTFVLASLTQRQPLLAVSLVVCLLLIAGPVGGACAVGCLLHLSPAAAAGSWPIAPLIVGVLTLTGALMGSQVALRRWWWAAEARQAHFERVSFQQCIRFIIPLCGVVAMVVVGMTQIPVVALSLVAP